jgi:import inner membrane translocase subunit TIM8
VVHQLNDVCWKKCVTTKISSNTLSKAEETCAQNCVDRWMDAQIGILKHLEEMRH